MTRDDTSDRAPRRRPAVSAAPSPTASSSRGGTSSGSRGSRSWRSSRSSSRSCSCCCSRSCSAARSRSPAIRTRSAYREYLMPGIFAQTIVFAAATVAIGMCDDINKGIVDRFRSLPMARSAVLTGRSVADVVYNAGILVVLMVTGFVVGWTNHNGIVGAPRRRRPAAAVRLRDVWIGIWLGTSVPSVEVAQQVSFTVLFPITFVSTAFVPLAALPDWLQPFALWNPVSTLTVSLRQLWGNPNPTALTTDSPATQEPILVTLIWVVVDRRDLRAARHPSLPIAEPLTMPRPPGCSRSGCSSACSCSSRPDGCSSPGCRRPSIGGYALGLWLLAMFVAIRPVAARLAGADPRARVPRAVRGRAGPGGAVPASRRRRPGGDAAGADGPGRGRSRGQGRHPARRRPRRRPRRCEPTSAGSCDPTSCSSPTARTAPARRRCSRSSGRGATVSRPSRSAS